MLVKILIVNDSSDDRSLIKNALSEYFVITACNGAEAIGVLEEQDGINLLIIDLDMPGMDGLQLLELLKKDERLRELRIIVVTNRDEMDSEIKALKLGAVDYIRKPINMDLLKARIDLHVDLLRAEQALMQKLSEQALLIERALY